MNEHQNKPYTGHIHITHIV